MLVTRVNVMTCMTVSVQREGVLKTFHSFSIANIF